MPLSIKQLPKTEWTKKAILTIKGVTNFFGTAGIFFWLLLFFSILALFSWFFKSMALLTFIIFCCEYWGIVDKVKKRYTENKTNLSIPKK